MGVGKGVMDTWWRTSAESSLIIVARCLALSCSSHSPHATHLASAFTGTRREGNAHEIHEEHADGRQLRSGRGSEALGVSTLCVVCCRI